MHREEGGGGLMAEVCGQEGREERVVHGQPVWTGRKESFSE